MPVASASPLKVPLSELRGVGPERAAQLARLELYTVGDLLLHKPRRYEDRRHVKKIRQVVMGEATTVFGKVVACGLKLFAKRTKSVFEIVIDDDTARLHCRWWNLPFMEKYFQVGDEVLAYGKVNSLKPRTIDHPETEVLEAGEEPSIHINRFASIYPLTEGLPQRWLRSLVWRTLQEYGSSIEESNPEVFQKSPKSFLKRVDAIRVMHFPANLAEAERARERLAMDEFVALQFSIQNRRKKLETNARSLPCSGNNVVTKPFLSKLGFKLTDAQTSVLREIRKDMSGKVPMRRLLQGDVGAGKTVVAACTALMALECGFSVALMAPTEILAEQHYRNFRRWFEPFNIPVELLTGSIKTVSSGSQKGASVAPKATLFIGTHALIEGSFTPENLGLVIIDEQHKFGVAQREKLLRKGKYPHLLVMTATPIPRTLGLTLYGDLDISVIDRLPGGRGQIKTFVRSSDKLEKVWEFVRKQLKDGRQAYVVYARVDDTGDGETKAVTKEFEKIRASVAPMRVGLLHGRLRPEEKDRIMSEFRANKIQVLLATSVIEVGVDVPNATLMIIENADQFGLAQLHQIRGRIGRGAHDSYCILVATAKTPDAQRRLKIMEETTDGFRIADEDLKIRGPGELTGSAQSGLPPLKFGDLSQDRELVELARKLVKESLMSK